MLLQDSLCLYFYIAICFNKNYIAFYANNKPNESIIDEFFIHHNNT